MTAAVLELPLLPRPEPPRLAVAPNPADWPRGVRLFAKKINTDAGWRFAVVEGEGTLVEGGLSEDTDSDGKRHRVSRTVDVVSYTVRLRHDGAGIRAWAGWHAPRTPEGVGS